MRSLGEDLVSVACPLTRRWGRTLSPEFKSGACHAGEYETLARPRRPPEVVVLAGAATALPEVAVSLSEGIKAGKHSFAAMGLDRAYTGAPARATAAEGEEMLALLATMIATEVVEGLAKKGGSMDRPSKISPPSPARGAPQERSMVRR